MNKNCVLLFTMTLLGCGNHSDVVTPEVKPLIEAVYASGFVTAKDEYQVFVQADGYLADKLVEDGDDVKKNDILFIIESGQQSARFNMAKESFELAKKNAGSDSPVLQELRAALSSAKPKLKFDSLHQSA